MSSWPPTSRGLAGCGAPQARRRRRPGGAPGPRPPPLNGIAPSRPDTSSAVRQSAGAVSRIGPCRESERSRTMDEKQVQQRDEQRELTPEEIEELENEELPDREAMSLVNANVAVPVNAAVAANVLSDHSTATAGAAQTAPISETITE